MARKRFTAEECIHILREAEVPQAQGKKTPEVFKQIGTWSCPAFSIASLNFRTICSRRCRIRRLVVIESSLAQSGLRDSHTINGEQANTMRNESEPEDQRIDLGHRSRVKLTLRIGRIQDNPAQIEEWTIDRGPSQLLGRRVFIREECYPHVADSQRLEPRPSLPKSHERT